MAETYRKAKIEHYVGMLALRKQTLKQQIEREEFKEMRDYLQGQLSAIELIVNELKTEFALLETPASSGEEAPE
jgi:hypothetical protein